MQSLCPAETSALPSSAPSGQYWGDMTALKSYLDEIALLATLAQEISVKYYMVVLGAEEPHPYESAPGSAFC